MGVFYLTNYMAQLEYSQRRDRRRAAAGRRPMTRDEHVDARDVSGAYARSGTGPRVGPRVSEDQEVRMG